MADEGKTDRNIFTAFNFKVLLTLKNENTPLCNAAFAEVDGMEMTMEPKTIREGGNNTGPIHLVGPVSYGQLSLKRGMTDSLDLWNWFEKVVQQDQSWIRASGEIMMLSSDRRGQLNIILTGCLPVKLKAPALNAKDGLLAIEEMTIAYETLRVEKSK